MVSYLNQRKKTMKHPKKATKDQILKMIKELEKNPEDKVSILGQSGITIGGAALGAAAAGTIASAAGATTLLGSTTLASALGGIFVTATPIGWVIGCSVAVSAAAYGISTMINDGGISKGRKRELLLKYQEDYRKIEEKERLGEISSQDRTSFIISLKELIESDVLSPNKAFKLIYEVEQGRIEISEAIKLTCNLLKNNVNQNLNP